MRRTIPCRLQWRSLRSLLFRACTMTKSSHHGSMPKPTPTTSCIRISTIFCSNIKNVWTMKSLLMYWRKTCGLWPVMIRIFGLYSNRSFARLPEKKGAIDFWLCSNEKSVPPKRYAMMLLLLDQSRSSPLLAITFLYQKKESFLLLAKSPVPSSCLST